MPPVLPRAFQQVEDDGGYVAYGLSVEQAIARQLAHFMGTMVSGTGDNQPFAVDAFHRVALFADHEAFAVVLLLYAVERIEHQVAERMFVGRLR